jgi:hypothetical protein
MFCSHCGEELPGDNTRFCSNCGAVRAARLTNPSSIVGTGKTPPPVVSENNQVVANQKESSGAPMPPLHMKLHPEGEEFPTWMSKLHHDPHNEQSRKNKSQPTRTPPQQEVKAQDALVREPDQDTPGQQSVPELVTHALVIEHPAQSQHVSDHEQLDFPELPSTPQPFSSLRELHVKVWNEANPAHEGIVPKEEDPMQSDPKPALAENKQVIEAVEGDEYAIEDIPTRLVESIPAAQPQQARFPIDDIPTTPLLAMSGIQPQSLSGIQQQSLHGQNVYIQQESGGTPDGATDIANIRTTQLQVPGRNQIASSIVSQSNRPVALRGMPASLFRGEKGRLPVIVGIVAVALLLVLGSWIIIFQPFSVSPATNVQLSYADTKLGVSLQYPNGWKTPQADYKKRVITLLDASDTAQVNIAIADVPTGSLNSYLHQQATKLGMSNPKSGSVTTFAAASWQQIQGDVQVKGAQYTCVLFATVDKNHLYTLSQMAPSNIYPDEEKLVFAPTRLSLRVV